jgi:hypothetical protein
MKTTLQILIILAFGLLSTLIPTTTNVYDEWYEENPLEQKIFNISN